MKKNFYKSLIFAFVALLATSCGTTEEFVLLNDLDVDSYYKMQQMQELKIKRGDDLRIVVTHKLPMLAEMFNNKINTVEGGESLTTYTVNGDGYINYPLLDSVKAEGLTCSELEQKMSQIIADRGLAYGATVSVKITNFKVTVIGESGTGIYEFEDGRATIFDLVAKANLVQSNSSFNGGMGIRRDKILIMREVDGVLTSEYVSLLSKDIMFSQYYYLQQNDIIYVWPSQTTIRNSNKIFDFWWSRLSIVTTAVSAVTLLVTLFGKKN
ncbi:MAG: polysaccharide biosynthesis/export family protein [Bacteroidales bacterium]|nr:polysaccharide biosynthesis/export family protein [Bacteroidales bacterium]MBR3828558.1 polysaccharide biosynthesis/export family protein [Bacteroidales bacterium]MBR6331329.1 polysaccharide biosynthesis/export family protein [Bacteroidales bacterium]